MFAGRSYVLEGLVAGYEKMRLTLQVSPSSARIVPPAR